MMAEQGRGVKVSVSAARSYMGGELLESGVTRTGVPSEWCPRKPCASCHVLSICASGPCEREHSKRPGRADTLVAVHSRT